MSRYSRQILYEHLREAGQSRLCASRVTLIGCGALGTVLANTLARAGVGFLRIVDRDFVELNNLQRQVLFDEADVKNGTPKSVAAANRLATINSEIQIDPVVADANHGNIETLVDGANLILDGTDNFETRYLINDVSVKRGIPWIYGACVGAEGMVMPILPDETPCLRCIFDEPPPPGSSPTCDTAGVLAPIVQVVASLQAMEAFKLLSGRKDALNRQLVQIQLWEGEFTGFDMQSARDNGDCICCKQRKFEYLSGAETGRTVSLCGRNAVQVRPASDIRITLEDVAARIAPAAKAAPTLNRYLLRFEVDQYEITLFRDGRAIIKGVREVEEGRTVYARYIGV